jgi:hypothetical protein
MANNLTQESARLMLDWICGGSNPTRPPGRWGALAIGGLEIGAGSGYVRQTMSFAPVTSCEEGERG